MVLNTSVPVFADSRDPKYHSAKFTVGHINVLTSGYAAVGSWHVAPNAVTQILIDKTRPERRDVFCVSTGQVVLTWPGELTAEDTEDIEAWLEIVKRRMKRSCSN